MHTTTEAQYETDFAAWADEMAAALRAGRLDEVDLENVAEEIEGLARAERRAVRSQLQRLMMHLLKYKIQPERAGKSWQNSIESARDKIRDELEDSPSLRRHLEGSLERVYRLAVAQALREARQGEKGRKPLPEHCPWNLDELLSGEMNVLIRAGARQH
jgi:hypothetical protein